jgi:hypothetical protein
MVDLLASVRAKQQGLLKLGNIFPQNDTARVMQTTERSIKMGYEYKQPKYHQI